MDDCTWATARNLRRCDGHRAARCQFHVAVPRRFTPLPSRKLCDTSRSPVRSGAAVAAASRPSLLWLWLAGWARLCVCPKAER